MDCILVCARKQTALTHTINGAIMKILNRFISKEDRELVSKCESIMDVTNSGMMLNIARSLLIVTFLIPLGYFIVKHTTIWIFGVPQNPMFYWLVFPVVVAPLVEELCKKYAMHRGYGYLFTFIFAAMEGYIYVVAMMAGGVPTELAVLVRLKAFCLHMGTITVQTHFYKMSKEEGRPYLAWHGFVIAVLLHAGWNLFASM